MYIKKKDRELFKELDNNLFMPDRWKTFIQEVSVKNRLIIKEGKKYSCTNCHTIFDSKENINEYCKCPNCKNIYLVKSTKLKCYDFKNELAILDKYLDYYIVRMFRLSTIYKNNQFTNYYYEYGRRIYDSNYIEIDEIVNENVVGTIGGMFPSYRDKYSQNWRYFRSYSSYLPYDFYYYPYNLEKLLSKRTELKYSQLWELVKHVECNLIYLIKNYNPSIELLTKLKLYNLALCPKTFVSKKTFEERFIGLPKEYLPFIQEYNLDIDELLILSYLKFRDINYIHRYMYMNEEDLRFLKERVNLKTLVEKTDFGLNSRFYEYRDYLDIAKKLKLNLKDKRILYPKNIKTAHDKLLKEYKQKKDKRINNSIKKRCEQLKENEFHNNRYIIFPAQDLDSLIDESSQQNNCVRTYAERIAEGKCDIYFMRKLKQKGKSLVTVEVKENKIVQKRTKNNEVTSKDQDKFLNIWENRILKGR